MVSKPSKKQSRIKWISVSGFLLVIATCSLPQLTLFPVYREGARLIPLIEKYKEARGSYPESLDQLDVELQFGKSGFRGIKYRVNEDRTEFTMVCFAFGNRIREVYNSKKGNWHRIF